MQFSIKSLGYHMAKVKIIFPPEDGNLFNVYTVKNENEFLGEIFVILSECGLFEKFLFRFREKSFQWITPLVVWIEFKLLLSGCQLFKKNYEEFERVFRTAKNEEEFCVLAGMS